MFGKACKLIAISALLSGCAVGGDLSREMANWQGEPVAEVLDAWGAPDSRTPIGDETLLTWTDRSAVMYGFADTAVAAMVVCERMLAVSDDGIISGWRWRGDHCNDVPASMRTRSLSAASDVSEP